MCHAVSCCALSRLSQQVTNPPIDPLREGLVMSLEMRLGGRGNLLQPSGNTYRQVRPLYCAATSGLLQLVYC